MEQEKRGQRTPPVGLPKIQTIDAKNPKQEKTK